MLVTFACSKCQAHLETEASAAGAEVECPHCHAPVTVPRARPGPGTTIGGFKIKELLGKGGMGEVYLAHQRSLDRDVALKILPSLVTRDKDDTDRFLQEVRLLARLDHPNIVTAYEAGEDDGVLYLAMAFINGDSVEARLKREGPYEEADALKLARKLASALAYAWNAHRLLHRDIKPSNILIDARGEPRLADLGLGKSLSSGMQLTMVSTMMGTPNYMSPEQAEAAEDLDFRADIYSLGATLYHMLTAAIPFGGSSLIDTIRKQATQSLADPRRIRPGISEPCVELLERMLTRDPRQRHESWEALIEDIDRVLTGEHPKPRTALESGESVLAREEVPAPRVQGARIRTATAPQRPAAPARKPVPPSRKPWPAIGVAAGILILAIACVAGWLLSRRETPAPPAATADVTEAPKPGPEPSKTVVPAVAPQAPASGQAFDDALRYAREHPEDSSGALSRFEAVQKTAAGTAWEAKASEEIVRLKGARQTAIDKALDRLRADAEALFGQDKPDEAIALAKSYSGPYSVETAQARASLTEALTQRRDKALLARESAVRQSDTAKSNLVETVDAIAADLLKPDASSARRRIEDAQKSGAMQPVAAEWTTAKSCAEQVLGMRELILASLKRDVGGEVVVTLARGPEKLQITGVDGGEIRANRITRAGEGIMATTPRNFRYEDLSVREKLARLGDGKTPDLEIMRGLLAWEAKNPETARKLFVQSSCLLGEKLAARVDAWRSDQEASALAEKKTAEETAAAQTYLAMVKLACPELAAGGTLSDTGAVVRAVRRKRFSETQVSAIQKQSDAFKAKYAATDYAKTCGPVVRALDAIRPDVPMEVDPAELDKVKERLQRANPGSPINWLAQITEDGLAVDVSKNDKLQDLSPLAKLPIQSLDLSKTPVTDLSPLKGLPLTSLKLDQCRDLKDLSPLKHMPLKSLSLINCDGLADLRPLHGMPMTTLTVGCFNLTDLQPLRGMPLTTLSVTSDRLEDLAPLKGLPLTSLRLVCCGVTEIGSLRGLPLTSLEMHNLPRLASLRPLEGMKLTWLIVADCREVADLAPLTGMPLAHVELRNTAVGDLSPLKGMPLTYLDLRGSVSVADVRPLQGMPLRYLNLGRTHVTDLAPLKGMVTLMELYSAANDQVRP